MSIKISAESAAILERISQQDPQAHRQIASQLPLKSSEDGEPEVGARQIWLLYMRCATGAALDLEIEARTKTFLFAPDAIQCLERIAEIDKNLVVELTMRALATDEPYMGVDLMNRLVDEMYH
jgi:hypothetical protein